MSDWAWEYNPNAEEVVGGLTMSLSLDIDGVRLNLYLANGEGGFNSVEVDISDPAEANPIADALVSLAARLRHGATTLEQVQAAQQ